MPHSNWTKDQFRTFLLIYAANADMNESELEDDLIRNKSMVDDSQ